MLSRLAYWEGMSQDEEMRLQAHLTVEIEMLERRLESWQDKTLPTFRKAIERKQMLQRELDLSKRRQAIATSPKTDEFTHSPDYRSVTLRGQRFSLTSRQAQMIEVLHDAYKNGNPEVSQQFVLEELETANSRWQDTFKSNPAARKALVAVGKTRGNLRLNV